MIQRIAILGTGLIGGSLGLAVHQRQPECTIVGHDEPEVLETAERRGAIDAKAADPITAIRNADLVILATPLSATLRLMEQIAPHLDPDTMLTDVASVKGPVIDQAQDVLPETVRFVGGHPMAGSEEQGIAHASPLLFENAAYVLAPLPGTEADTLRRQYAELIDLIQAIGARPLVLDAYRHDRIAATVSHVPQLVAVSLVNTLRKRDETDETALRLAAGGFRDMTRIASSPFDMWRDILIGNQGAILDALSHFLRTFQTVRNRLADEDLEALDAAFQQARDIRTSIPRDTKGFLHPLADLYVEAQDEPGVLHHMTGVLTRADLNIKDIELLKFREGTGGTFRLSFANDADAVAAVEALNDAGYNAHRP